MRATRIPFTKVESVGNDFVLVEASDLPDSSDDALRTLAIRACERRFGIGSDGLLLVTPPPAPSTSGDGEGVLGLRMFNPDGSEDFCGNGLRCAAVFAKRKGWAKDRMTIHHGWREIPAEILPSGSVRTDMGSASFAPRDVPLDECTGELFMAALELEDATLTVSALTTGSTHLVIMCDDLPKDRAFGRISRALEHHPLFPMRTSVIWARETGEAEALGVENWPPNTVHSTPDTLQIRIWERGAGETLGCGTGSSAAAVVHMRGTGKGGSVIVENPGGRIVVSAERWDSSLSVEGPARVVYTGHINV